MATIRFHFDFISPYAYLAWTQIHALAERHQARVEPVPVLFAALLDAHGTLGPAEVPAKRNYLVHDVHRIARRFGVRPPLPPPAHPFNPLLALRASSLSLAASDRRRLIDALFAAVWQGGGGVEGDENVASIARGAGLDGEAVIAGAKNAETKEKLRTQTEAAIRAGIFGVPSMIVEDQLFWGVDSLPHLEAYLEGAPPIGPTELARWAAMPATAQRKR